MKKILVINGPNLNMLGKREPEIYGSRSLDDINRDIKALGEKMGAEVDFFQSNIEGEIVTAIHSVLDSYDGCIINAGAYTHYSVAIHDAIAAVEKKPFIEVHLSNVHTREEYRHKSMLSPVCKGVILGFGEKSYSLALKALCED
ncbi:MAG: type II 3-dehydroquinate dehydratase [Clostridia bacterium]|nr:type II 3-dehydroquinate dehydratase [Clostridia bacterium]